MTDQDPKWQPPLGSPVDIPTGPPTSPPTEVGSDQPPFGQLSAGGDPTSIASENGDGMSAHSASTATDATLGVVWSVVGFGVFLVAALIGLLLSLPFVDIDFAEMADSSNMPVGAIGMSLVFQQLGQAFWPLGVAKWLPGVNWSDLRIGFKPVDLGIGLGTAFISLFAASVFGFAAAQLVGLEDQSAAENSKFLSDAKGSPWLYLIVLCVVVGAPIAEELFFRGLVLSAFEKLGSVLGRKLSTSAETMKRASMVVGVAGSTLIFTLPHFIGGTAQETVVLFSSIGAVGVVLALAAIYTNRLGASIVAHMIFNSVGAAAALGAFDSIQPT